VKEGRRHATDWGDRPRATQRVSRLAIPVVGAGWLLAMVIAFTRSSWYLVGEATVGSVAGLLGLCMLLADWWPGKSGWPFFDRDSSPLKGWYGRSGPMLLVAWGLALLIGAVVQDR
jgi:hypothetical protein